MTSYCRYGGLDDEGKPHVTGLGGFESMVLEHLWAAIAQEFPPPPPPPSEIAYERAFHVHFVEDRSRGFIGRQAMLADMTVFADDPARGDSLPLVIHGTPGSGKTSMICSFAKCYAETHPEVVTLVHVVSASPSSTDVREMLLRLSRELVDRFTLLDWREDVLVENQAVKEAFLTVLAKAGEEARREGTHVIIIIDAVNQLSSYNGAWGMDWLPTYSPPCVRIVLTSTSDSECMAALAKRDPRPPQWEIPPLSTGEREEIVRQQLTEYRKKLTRGQLALLLDKKESAKPLFLLTACEELRLQAQYGMDGTGVDEKIRDLPGEVPLLLDVVLERVERDMGTWAKASAATALLPDVTALADGGGGAMTASDDGDVVSSPVVALGGAGTGDVSAAATSGSLSARSRRGSRSKRSAGTASDGSYDSNAATAGAAGKLDADPGRIFNDSIRDPDLLGKQVVKKALTLILVSRHGLQESELLELLAPRGKKMLPPM